MTCPSCGIGVPEGARFCPSCGHTVQARADERRIATVLFGDLVGFTSMSEGSDPETVKNLVDRCFDRLAADIVGHGGRVDKIVGDAIVALFGAPVAHEDDAERAVRSALQMQSTLAELAEQLSVDVRMRIGVNTGEVLVGRIPAGDDYTAMGDVVNAAQRLQQAAEPGQVLVGPDTHECTQSTIRYREVGEVDLRGRAEPLITFEALEPVTRPGRRPRRARTPLVGRDSEMSMLRGAMGTAVEHRRAHMVLLTGEAGVGKSRLAGEMAVEAGLSGAFVLEGHCVPYGEANVWYPVAEALQQACGIEPTDSQDDAAAKARAAVTFALGDEDPERLEQCLQGLLYVMGDERALGDVDPTRARDDVVLAVQVAIAGLARHHPVLIVFSDIHWADDRVLDLIERLVARLAHEPLVLVATARPDLTDRWSPPAGAHNLVRLQLDPLRPTDAAALLDDLADGLPASLRTTLLERSGGNPFFLEEMVALLGDRSDDESVEGLPATLRGLVSARIDQLTASERGVLEDAAVVGRSGDLDSLTGLAARRGQPDQAGVVRRLVDRDLLSVLDGTYEFKTDLIREVAYQTLTKAERARRHAIVAQLLEQRVLGSGRADEQLEALAHHWGTAAELVDELGAIDGLPDDVCKQALITIEKAAVRAEAQDEPLVVIRLLDQALRLLADDPGRHRWRALLGRAKAHAAVHDLSRALADAETARAETEASDDERMRAEALTVMGEVLTKAGRHEESAQHLDQAVERWRTLGDRRGVARALRLHGFNDVLRNELDAAEPVVREALALYRELGDRRGEAWALQHLAWMAFLRGQPAIADERLEKSATAFAEVGDRGGEGWAKGLLAWVRFQQGRLDEAEVLAMKVLPQARERGERWAVGILNVLLANVALWRGRAADAVQRGADAHLTFVEIDDRFGQVQALGVLARARAAVGDLAGSRSAIDLMWVMSEDEPSLAAMADPVAGSVGVFLGDVDAAQALVDRHGGPAPTPDQIIAAERQVTLGLAFLQTGAVDDALAVLDGLSVAEEGHGVRAYFAAPAALALSAGGRLEEAAEVVAAFDLADDGTYLDRVTVDLAAALVSARTGRHDDARQRASRALTEIDATDDAVAQIWVRLGCAHVESLVGGDPDPLRLEVAARSSALGAELTGWDRAFALAAARPTTLPA